MMYEGSDRLDWLFAAFFLLYILQKILNMLKLQASKWCNRSVFVLSFWDFYDATAVRGQESKIPKLAMLWVNEVASEP